MRLIHKRERKREHKTNSIHETVSVEVHLDDVRRLLARVYSVSRPCESSDHIDIGMLNPFSLAVALTKASEGHLEFDYMDISMRFRVRLTGVKDGWLTSGRMNVKQLRKKASNQLNDILDWMNKIHEVQVG